MIKPAWIVICSVSILALGWVAEALGVLTAVQKSGAILVAGAIILIYFEVKRLSDVEIRRKIENDAKFPTEIRDYYKNGVHLRTETARIIDGGNSADGMARPGETVRSRTLTVDQQVADICRISDVEKRLRVVEATILVVGTLVAGFGDFIANYFIHCGQLTCPH